MDSSSHNSELKKYLAKPSTQTFIIAAKAFSGFCDQVVKNQPNATVLNEFIPCLFELYYCGSKLKPVPDPITGEWQEMNEPDLAYEALPKHLLLCFGKDFRFFYLANPQSPLHATPNLWRDEVLADIFLLLRNSFKHAETIVAASEIHTGLAFLKRGFDEQCGTNCAILISALHRQANSITPNSSLNHHFSNN